jgi:hypothetical protein
MLHPAPLSRLRAPKAIAPLLACVAFGSGCPAPLMPGVPAGPIVEPGFCIGTSYSYAYAPGTVHAVDPGAADLTVHDNSAMLSGRSPSVLPAGPSFRVAPRRWLDFAVDLGLREIGLQARAGPLDASRALPWGVELELRTGAYIPDTLMSRRNVVRARAEVYPPLPFGRSDSGAQHGFGVLALGLSTGTQLLTVNDVPSAYSEETAPFSDPSFDARRWETRLESVVGLHWLSHNGAYTLAFLPWLTLQQGAIRETDCSACYLDIIDIESEWGLGIALTAFWRVE